MQHTLSSTFSPIIFTTLYPHSTITISLHILSQDGSLLASLINASTLALIDAGIPMKDYGTFIPSSLPISFSQHR
jgi:exosome complex component RRP41